MPFYLQEMMASNLIVHKQLTTKTEHLVSTPTVTFIFLADMTYYCQYN